MPMTETPKVVYEDAAQLIATWQNVLVSVLGHTAMTVSGVRAQVAATAAHGRASGPQRLLEIVLFDRDAPIPDADIRAVLDSGVAVVGQYYLAVASIFEGSGFRGAIIRGVLTSLSLLSRTEFPQRVFSTTAECVQWCSPLLERTRTPGASELTEVIAHVRSTAIKRKIFSS
ncbi:MAG: hypothetical protein ABJE95_25430 [Byssovorax sp.]